MFDDFSEGRDDWNLQSYGDRSLVFLFSRHRQIRAKSLCASLGEHSSLESLQTSVTTERLQSTSHTMPPCLTQQNLHASYWVVLCEARTPPLPRGTIISEWGQKALSHLPCTSHSDGTPLALPPRTSPNSSAHRNCIASPSWWTGIQRAIKSPALQDNTNGISKRNAKQLLLQQLHKLLLQGKLWIQLLLFF